MSEEPFFGVEGTSEIECVYKLLNTLAVNKTVFMEGWKSMGRDARRWILVSPGDTETTLHGHVVIDVPNRIAVLAGANGYIQERHGFYKWRKNHPKDTDRRALIHVAINAKGRQWCEDYRSNRATTLRGLVPGREARRAMRLVSGASVMRRIIDVD